MPINGPPWMSDRDEREARDLRYALEEIWRKRRDNELAFFLGAGASLHDPTPSESASHDRMPSVRDLQIRLTEAWGGGPTETPASLTDLASYFDIYQKREVLADLLTRIFTTEYAPGRLHRYLAQFPGSPLIVTTNYDQFVERAFDAVGRPYQLIVNTLDRYRRDPERFVWFEPGDPTPRVLRYDEFSSVPLETVPTIFKIHGSVGLPAPHRDTFVISEEDYYEMAGREHTDRLMPVAVRARLSRMAVVFVGYSARDIHVRHVLAPFSDVDRFSYFVFNKHVSQFDRDRLRRYFMHAFELDTDAVVDALERVPNPPLPLS